MRAQIPIEDPSRNESLAELTASYVRRHPLLRVLLALTVADHVAAVALVLFGRLRLLEAGVLAFFSVLTWFFAVALPVMNRAVRAQIGVQTTTYWAEVVEMFGRVSLLVVTGLYTYLLVGAAFSTAG